MVGSVWWGVYGGECMVGSVWWECLVKCMLGQVFG